MEIKVHPVADNVLYLRQGAALVRKLDDRLWSGQPDARPRSSVGSQFRHCIDFYDCFLHGLPRGRVDYNDRQREVRVEEDRDHAIARLESLIEAVKTLDTRSAHDLLQVRMEPAVRGAEAPGWCRSTVLRELQFLLSHTIHHYALIVALLSLHGHPLDQEFAEFGIAPSTLAYWRESGAATAAE